MSAISHDPWRRVAVLAVTHHSAAVIGDCLKSVAGASEVIVVDNASADDSCAIVARAAPGARIFHNPVGLGFGNGANIGLGAVTREFVLLINPDAVMAAGAVETLLAAADRYPEAAMLTPTVVDQAGAHVTSHDVGVLDRGRFPSGRSDPTPEGDLSAHYLSGAIMLLRMRALRAVGFFDPAIFLYYEDDDLCLRLRRGGWSLVLVRDAVASHIGGGSIGTGWDRVWEKFWHISWSHLYIVQKYAGAAAMHRIAWPNLCRFAVKSLGDALGFRKAKLVRDLARLCGTSGYLLGITAAITPAKGVAPLAMVLPVEAAIQERRTALDPRLRGGDARKS